MGRGDNRKTRKMRQRVGQAKTKAKLKAKIAGSEQSQEK